MQPEMLQHWLVLPHSFACGESIPTYNIGIDRSRALSASILLKTGYSAIGTKVLRAISDPHHHIEVAHHAFARQGLRPWGPLLDFASTGVQLTR